MLKQSTQKLEGNDRYEGYGIDLIKELSEMSGFNYTFIIQEDTNSGSIDSKTKKWDGMIGKVISGVSINDFNKLLQFTVIFNKINYGTNNSLLMLL